MTKEEKGSETVNDKDPVQSGIDNNAAKVNDGQEENLSSDKKGETDLLQKEVEELKDKYLRLYSEYENFRRRTSKEKSDLIKTANEDVLISLLPVLDDFERALKAINESKEGGAVKEGINLIYNKLYKTLEAKGVKPMQTVGQEFNSELHEAITQAPAPSEDMKGKVITEVEKGYYLNEKVIRFAKVIIGS
ncbi:MAG: nucleotide exchange factor GrpE [Cytophagaceae bacterium]|nr:nucleotide exchange factor GrpE [Cytophagaceae bacterium]